MKYHIVKLDARYSYHAHFQYAIEFSKSNWRSTGVLDFDRSRRWFTQAYGWTQDVETREQMFKNQQYTQNSQHYNDNDINSHWAYSARYREYRIYVATDSELSFFILTHPNAA